MLPVKRKGHLQDSCYLMGKTEFTYKIKENAIKGQNTCYTKELYSLKKEIILAQNVTETGRERRWMGTTGEDRTEEASQAEQDRCPGAQPGGRGL